MDCASPTLCALRWDQVDFEHGLLHMRRIKNGMASVHPLGGGELRALRKLQREAMPSRYVFTTERRAPMSPAGFRKMLARTGEVGAFPFPGHPHMLRPRAATSWPTTARTRGPCSIISGTRTSSTRCATPSSQLIASNPSGRMKRKLVPAAARAEHLPYRQSLPSAFSPAGFMSMITAELATVL